MGQPWLSEQTPCHLSWLVDSFHIYLPTMLHLLQDLDRKLSSIKQQEDIWHGTSCIFFFPSLEGIQIALCPPALGCCGAHSASPDTSLSFLSRACLATDKQHSMLCSSRALTLPACQIHVILTCRYNANNSLFKPTHFY